LLEERLELSSAQRPVSAAARYGNEEVDCPAAVRFILLRADRPVVGDKFRRLRQGRANCEFQGLPFSVRARGPYRRSPQSAPQVLENLVAETAARLGRPEKTVLVLLLRNQGRVRAAVLHAENGRHRLM